MSRARIWAVLGLLMLAACGGSPPTRFYTLDPVPAGSPIATLTGPPIQVGEVILPADLDRLGIVTRAGPDRLSVSDQDRWAAPLDGMFRRVLAADLAARLPDSKVLAPGDPAPAGVRILTVNVRRFESDAGGHVTLDAGWALLNGRAPVRRGHEVIALQAGSAAGPEAAAMSRALGELASRIVRAIAG